MLQNKFAVLIVLLGFVGFFNSTYAIGQDISYLVNNNKAYIEYLVKPIFSINTLSDDRKLEIKIGADFLEKSQFNILNDQLCLYSYTKDTLVKIKNLGCNNLEKKSVKKLDGDTMKFTNSGEEAYFVSFAFTIEEDTSKSYYGIGSDFIDKNSVVFKSNKDSYSPKENITIESGIIKTINGNILKDDTKFYIPDSNTFLSSKGGIITYTTSFATPKDYQIYFKYPDHTYKNIDYLFQTNSFKINDDDYFKITDIDLEVSLTGSDLVIKFDDAHTIENISISTPNNKTPYTDPLKNNQYTIQVNALGSIFFGNQDVPKEAEITVKGFNIKDNQSIFTKEKVIKINLESYIKGSDEVKNSALGNESNYYTGIQDKDALDDLVSGYSREEVDLLKNKYKDQIDSYESDYKKRELIRKMNHIIGFIVTYKYFILFGLFISIVAIISLIRKYKKK